MYVQYMMLSAAGPPTLVPDAVLISTVLLPFVRRPHLCQVLLKHAIRAVLHDKDVGEIQQTIMEKESKHNIPHNEQPRKTPEPQHLLWHPTTLWIGQL